ncbi:nucleophile aminohydrolase [Tribonema minus]|uniref:Nucleophile aminohydrolase n=1 Tax=Tribonema minus TaxID=303371 RepID=A0A836CG92_9STRA|nr:nucleophile aminohydrolase [Tribonema minus]
MKMLALAKLLYALESTAAESIAPSAPTGSFCATQHKRILLRLRGGDREQRYSQSKTLFSPTGRIPQLEYAGKAVYNGALALGVTFDGGVVLATARKLQSPLIRALGTPKIAPLSRSVCLTYAGLSPDSRVLVARAHAFCAEYVRRYGEEESGGGSGDGVPVEPIVAEIASVMQAFSQAGGARPFGVSVLVAGVEKDVSGSDDGNSDCGGTDSGGDGCAGEGGAGQRDSGGPDGSVLNVDGGSRDDRDDASSSHGGSQHSDDTVVDGQIHSGASSGGAAPALYLLDPSGHHSKWRAVAIGQRSAEAMAQMEVGFVMGDMTRDTALQLAVDTLLSCCSGLERRDIDVAVVEPGRVHFGLPPLQEVK